METKSAAQETKFEKLNHIQYAPCGDCLTRDLPQAFCHLHILKMDQLEKLIKRVSGNNFWSVVFFCPPHFLDLGATTDV